MRVILVLTVLFSLVGCGSKKDDDKADTYQCCAASLKSGTTDLSIASEAKNAAQGNDNCTGANYTYTAAQCNVPAGSKGCSYTNSNGVAVINWFTGTSWTDGNNADTGKSAACTKWSASGVIVTK